MKILHSQIIRPCSKDLAGFDRSNSPLYIPTMDQELSRLELKISLVVEQCALVRAENIDLRQQVASQNDEIKRLKEKLKESGERLSRVVENLPG